jgi:putative PIN family toxin of toxin-antitoxin system
LNQVTLLRAVVDTNILVRAVIKPLGSVGPVLRRLRDGAYVLLYSEPLLTELVDVLNRPRIRDKYSLTPDDIETVVALVLLRGEGIVPTRRIDICRDPKDNMLLEAAADGNADVIVSGDKDLLDLEAFEEIPIIGPADFLARLGEAA